MSYFVCKRVKQNYNMSRHSQLTVSEAVPCASSAPANNLSPSRDQAVVPTAQFSEDNLDMLELFCPTAL